MEKESETVDRLLQELRRQLDNSRSVIQASYKIIDCNVHIHAQAEKELQCFHEAISHLHCRKAHKPAADDLHVFIGTLDKQLSTLIPHSSNHQTSRSHQYVYRHNEAIISIQRSNVLEVIQCYWADSGIGMYLIDDCITAETLTAPFRTILAWHGLQHKGVVLHAAAIGDHSGAFLYGGKSGSGKSIFSLYGADAGMIFLGDDAIFCKPGTPPRVSSMYNSVRLHEADLERVSLDYRGPVSERDTKWYAYLSECVAGHTQESAIEAIFLPADTDQTLPIQPATAFEALQVLAPSSLMHIPMYGEGLKIIRQLTEQISAYRVQRPSTSSDIPLLIQEVRKLQVEAR